MHPRKTVNLPLTDIFSNEMSFLKYIRNELVIKYGGRSGCHLSSAHATTVKIQCIVELEWTYGPYFVSRFETRTRLNGRHFER